MNLDFIGISKFLHKDTLCTEHLQLNNTYANGNTHYIMHGRKDKDIDVWHFPETNRVFIKGSIPYLMNGHNYHSSVKGFCEGLDYVSDYLKQDIYSFNVDSFEFGTIQKIPFNVSDFLHNHIKIKGTTPHHYNKGNILTGKDFENTYLLTKLYDVNRNMKSKVAAVVRNELKAFYDWNDANNYVKVENHYKKPDLFFRKNNVIVEDLLADESLRKLEVDLINTYRSIAKTGNIHIPSTKSDINVGTIPLMVLKEIESITDINARELINQKIKSIPENILNRNDRKARTRQINENFKKITGTEKSCYDITALLSAKLYAGNSQPSLYGEKG